MPLIKNSNRAKQGIEFSGVEWGKIHPSDIDFVLEFKNKVLILGEVKFKGIELTTGQKLMLERIADSWHTGISFVIFAHHTHEDDTTDIPLQKCEVYKIYYDKKWYTLQGSLISKINQIRELFQVDD
tara:strand:- start:2698 stop:3078 length:381 start_codon:yes stop_codon:yes gene_type:complete